ncbi:hypothetical protein [Streptomyces sp. bgisy091]|uniref:hypothetical protein n=1 Tax=Streptomyces sp. bgisy091 TaxID=3413778 RepID=UPI003D73D3E1
MVEVVPQIRRDLYRRTVIQIGRCALTYLLLHVAAWSAMRLVLPDGDPFSVWVLDALWVLVWTGTPSMLLAVVAGVMHTRMDAARFRRRLVAPMLLFAWPFLAFSTSEPLLFQAVAQVAFIWLTPAPLFPEKLAHDDA